MSQITINIPADKVDWILDGFSFRYNYQDTIPNPTYDAMVEIANPDYDPGQPEDPDDNPSIIPNPNFDDVVTIPNPQNKASFAKDFIIQYIKATAAQGHLGEDQKVVRAEQALVDLT